ncbi:pectate lyase [Halosimplex halophilum]|uniref:pectate lyase n=1 Tax=Halosimplex halophilum TaxID=2559572 RepID=UPI001FE9B322|nr:pectate lyase [Halosimplex halophilum]
MSEERGTDRSSDRSRSTPVTRRRLLALVGAGAAAGAAGCNALGGDSTDRPAASTDAPADGETATPEPTATPTTARTETTTGTAVPSGFDASVLDGSPSSHVAPTDGFADASWLSGAMPEVVTVTNLDASGEGSLRWALNREGARVVVFEVGGVVDLAGESLTVSRPNAFVAGQTAPSPGITLVRGGLHVEADNVILQHLRARPGDELSGPVDAIGNAGGSNVVIDHCTASWGTDEGLSTNSPDAPDVTITNNLVAECLVDSIHPKGDHSMGSLVMNNSDNVTLAGNLWAHNVGRHPRLKGGTSTAVVNNVMYDFDRGTNLGGGVPDETTASIVGNYYRAGAITDESEPVVGATFTDADGPVRAYVAYNETDPSMPVVDQGAPIESLSERPVWPDGITTRRAGEAYEGVLAGVGARPADRTDHDRRIVADVRDRTGSPIDSQDDVGGYPELEATTRELSVPDEGLGEWLREFTVAVESV